MNEREKAALRERYQRVRAQLAEAVRACGRAPEDVALVAVSKFHGAEAVRELATCGQRMFGESYVQEGRAKQAALADLDLEWHHIGHVQTNKAKDVAGHFALVHGVDSERLAQALDRAPALRMPGAMPQPVLIQVNIGREPQKSGVMPEGAPDLAERVAALPGLSLRGLMCLPPVCAPGEARPYFAALRALRDQLATRLGMELPCLSMGMSSDFAEAVAEGATMVRIGTDIFGARDAGR